jgi:hypothetical protein
MKTIWNLLEDEPSFPSLEGAGYKLINAEESGCDVMICGLEHVEYAGALANPQECMFIVALHDAKHEHYIVPSTFDAWIDRKKLDKLPLMLDAYKLHIEQKAKVRQQREIIERLSVDTSVHHVNLDGIKLSMRESTKEIESIFEERVEEMRDIHKDTEKAHEKLTNLKEQMVPQEFADLEESWNMTESILSRTDDVIQAMFGFITVLQCEDRITQMIDGIEKIMDDDIAYMSENGCNLIPADEDKLKERLISFYTIQDQRDYVQGIDNAMQGCKAKQADIEEFLLF